MTSFVPREILRHTVPVPDTVSPQMRNLNAAPLNPTWNTNPRTASEWKERINAGAAAVAGVLPALRKELRVNAEPLTIDGLKAYMATPEDIPSVNRNRLLIHLHGGCYVFFPASPEPSKRPTWRGSSVSKSFRSTIACRPIILICCAR